MQGSTSYIFQRSMEDRGSRIWYEEKWQKETNFVKVYLWINTNSTTGLIVNEKDSRRKTNLGESHSNVYDSHKDYKSETHNTNMHMDEDGT